MNETELEEYNSNNTNWASVAFKQKPGKDWATPFVTGYKYKIKWGNTNGDFNSFAA